MGNDASSQYGKKIPNNMVVKWVKDTAKCPFQPREGQAVAAIGSKLYLFGGVVFVENDAGAVTESDELLLYDTALKGWSKEEVSGECPSQRSGATMAAVGKCLYLFGGLSQFSGWMNDLFVYNTDTKIWTQIAVKNAPSPRDKVMSASVGDKIYIFGGFGPAQETDVNGDDILPLDDDDEYEDIDELQDVRDCQEAANFTWSDQLYTFDTRSEKWSLLTSKNAQVPSPRAAHSLSLVTDCAGNQWLYVFGGRDIESRQNDLWRFSILEGTWEQCQASGCQPHPRSFHAAASVAGRLIIHGGRSISNQHFNDLNVFDSETKEWLQPELSEAITSSGDVACVPPAMGLHSLCTVNGNVILYGGSSDLDPATGTCTKFSNDIFRLCVDDILQGGSIAEESAADNEQSKSETPVLPGLLNLKPSSNSSENNTSSTDPSAS